LTGGRIGPLTWRMPVKEFCRGGAESALVLCYKDCIGVM